MKKVNLKTLLLFFCALFLIPILLWIVDSDEIKSYCSKNFVNEKPVLSITQPSSENCQKAYQQLTPEEKEIVKKLKFAKKGEEIRVGENGFMLFIISQGLPNSFFDKLQR